MLAIRLGLSNGQHRGPRIINNSEQLGDVRGPMGRNRRWVVYVRRAARPWLFIFGYRWSAGFTVLRFRQINWIWLAVGEWLHPRGTTVQTRDQEVAGQNDPIWRMESFEATTCCRHYDDHAIAPRRSHQVAPGDGGVLAHGL